ncbi:MAG: transaldolase [Actinomycetota bacterium]
MTSPIARLNEYGQSPWYDNLTRQLVQGGTLAQLIDEDGIRGVTSNPTIFAKAMAGGEGYDDQLRDLRRQDLAIDAVYWELVLADIRAAADVLRPTHDRLDGHDGFVSVEVAPDRAFDTSATITQVHWLRERADRPNVLVKIPATAAGIPAIEDSTADGISVNITLIFSLARYREVVEAYLRGLERHAEAGGDVSRVASVASFFVSRVDTEADKRLPAGHRLRGRVAVANAKLAYRLFRQRFAGERWEALASKGARVQRPLWASTSTKNPDYSDTLYVDELVGRDTVNTLAQPSIDALRDHGDPKPDTVEQDVDEADQVMAELPDAGVDYDDLTATIEREGVASFEQSYVDCLKSLEQRATELAA